MRGVTSENEGGMTLPPPVFDSPLIFIYQYLVIPVIALRPKMKLISGTQLYRPRCTWVDRHKHAGALYRAARYTIISLLGTAYMRAEIIRTLADCCPFTAYCGFKQTACLRF